VTGYKFLQAHFDGLRAVNSAKTTADVIELEASGRVERNQRKGEERDEDSKVEANTSASSAGTGTRAAPIPRLV
jgi:hypothetical protein